jgi:TolB-like protein/DNA-binding winged helix-turn-helix (wHTH) protein
MHDLGKNVKTWETAALNSSYGFGPFQVEPLKRILRRDGQVVPLTGKAFDILLVLIRRRSEVVSKEELMRLVWPDTAVEDDNLRRNVSSLRKALGEGPDERRYILTIAGRGYRFVADVREQAAALAQQARLAEDGNGTTSAAPASTPSNSASLRDTPPSQEVPDGSRVPRFGFRVSNFNRKAVLISAAILALIGLVSALNLAGLRDRLMQRWTAAPIQSLAVLPLQNLSGDASQDYFADGVTEELITDLAELGPLRVTSRTSVMQYKGTRRPLKEIAGALHADAIVEGAVQRSGSHVRITAQLIRASTDTHLWAGSYDGRVGDVLNFESQVAQAIARQVAVKLTPEASARLAGRQVVDPEAHELYLKGRYLWNQRAGDPLDEAAADFRAAIARDPNYAAAYAGLADADALIAMDASEPLDLLAKAKAAATRAIELDPQIAEAHTSLAGVRILADWDWKGGAEELRRALAIDPQYALAHHWYATLYLGPQGEIAQAVAEMQKAVQLDSLSPIYLTDLGWTYYVARQYDEAIRQYQQALNLNTDFEPAHFRLRRVYVAKGMYAKAFEEAMRSHTTPSLANPPNVKYWSGLQEAYDRSGYQGVLKYDLANAAYPGRHPLAPVGWANLYLGLGDRRAALAQLRKGLAVHDPGLIYLKVDPQWDSLRPEAGFQEIERQIGLEP